MRLLLVSDLYPPVRGGLEFHVDGLATQLSELGHEVHVATLTRDPVPTGARVTVHSLPGATRLLPHEDRDRPLSPPLPDPAAGRALRRLLRTIRPDVVHGHNWLAASVPRGRDSPPFVYTAHDYGLICQLRTLLQSRGSACSGPGPTKCSACAVTESGWVRTVTVGPATALSRRRLHADLVVAVSRHVRNALRPYLRCDIAVVPNLYSTVVTRRPPNLPPRFVLYAGSPGKHKGLPDLIRLWRTDPPDTPLVVATTQPFTEPVPRGVTTMVLTREDVRGALQMADLAVIPSRWDDPCPTIALEALASGTPVVATRVGGIPEIIRDGVDGLLVPPRSCAALGAGVRQLLDDAELRSRMSVAARKRAELFAAPRIAAQVVEVYDEVLARRRASRDR